MADIPLLQQLYMDTILHINSHDYTPAQTAAWAGTGHRTASLQRKLATQHFYVAVTAKQEITGFASLENDGELDMMFVHKDYQRQGIATLLIRELYRIAAEKGIAGLTAYVSITARPFFEKEGFEVVARQTTAVNGVEMDHFKMQKENTAIPLLPAE